MRNTQNEVDVRVNELILFFHIATFESVHNAPPSPVVKILFPAKLKMETSPKEPVFSTI